MKSSARKVPLAPCDFRHSGAAERPVPASTSGDMASLVEAPRAEEATPVGCRRSTQPWPASWALTHRMSLASVTAEHHQNMRLPALESSEAQQSSAWGSHLVPVHGIISSASSQQEVTREHDAAGELRGAQAGVEAVGARGTCSPSASALDARPSALHGPPFFAARFSEMGRRLECLLSATQRRCQAALRLPSLHVQLPVFRLPFFAPDDTAAALVALNHVYAGTMARTLSQVVCHPVDTVKTRMQIADPSKKLRKWRRKISRNAIELGPVELDNWFFKGPGDLFRGVWGAILGTIPNAMLYFVAYESTKKALERSDLPGGVVHVASASVGTFAASIVRVPADTLKHRVQAYMHKNVLEACQAILQAEGLSGLYKGFWPTLLRDIPEIAIQFSVYESLRAFVREKRKVEKLTTPEHLMLGACAGAIAATCTIPLDLVKTRQQCGTADAIHRVVLSVIAESGPLGLLAGLGPRAFHVSLMSAVFFGLFEYCKLMMKPDRTASDKLYLPKILKKRRSHIWKRQFVYTE